ncbi:pilus assembly protein TadG-related protein [Nitriliruptor alkaliphilus]|uniref:pilus assembly protein TadG-related protein n=1 Tax=Nitriliruptor alkaliphilus TaxID=427918 RepID=UPI001B80C638|nr:pilus assembly protein TadG-related protein [Nitriliruptor alkaliphilus]
MNRRWQGDESGALATPVLLLVWCGLCLAIVVVDVGAYLVAASRAQGAADAAALAAVAADLAQPAPPHIVARSVAGRNRARVESCHCRAGSGRVEVEVSVPVGGVVISRVGMQRVTASAEAELVHTGS